MILPIHEDGVGLVPLVIATKIELLGRHFLQGHAPLILKGVTSAAAVQQLDARCQVDKQAVRVVLRPEEYGRKRMGVIICTIEQKERHLSDEHKKLQRSADQVPPRWDNQAWTDSKERRQLETAHTETLWLPWKAQRELSTFNLIQRRLSVIPGFKAAITTVDTWD
jgi:hypothetical protein